MFMNILVLVLLGVIGYVWVLRGFFSAILHLCCAIAAGAIAFALWEPLALTIINKSGSQWIQDLAWSLSLILPFGLVLAVLTSATNALVRANAQCESTFEYIGGGICGLLIGVIATGILTISLSFVRVHGDFMGHEPVAQEKDGYLTHGSALWVPVDSLVASAYGVLSTTTFRTGSPLATLYPDLALRGHVMRIMPEEALLKVTGSGTDVGLAGRYTVGERGTIKIDDLLKDTFNTVKQSVKDLDGESLSGQYKIEGYVLATKAGMRESNGQVIFGPGSAQLIVEGEDGPMTIYPIAFISQAKGDNTDLGRWRFDGKGVFFGSAGAAANPPVAIEFIVPANAIPLYLYVKGVRMSLIDEETETTIKAFDTFEDVAERDRAIRDRTIVSVAKGNVTTANPESPPIKAEGSDSPIQATNRLPFRITLNAGAANGLDVVKEGKANYIRGGDAKFRKEDLASIGMDRALRLEEFLVDGETAIVQLDVSPSSVLSIVSPEAKEAGGGAPTLIDNRGQTYEAVGFIYQDSLLTHIRFMPGSPIQGDRDLPSISANRPDQKLILLFRVSIGVEIKSYAIGSKGIQDFKPTMKINQSQRRR